MTLMIHNCMDEFNTVHNWMPFIGLLCYKSL